jgi:hypothetical protein
MAQSVIATGYELDGRRVGVRVPVRPRMCSYPRRRDRPWSLPSHPPNEFMGTVKQTGQPELHVDPHIHVTIRLQRPFSFGGMR